MKRNLPFNEKFIVTKFPPIVDTKNAIPVAIAPQNKTKSFVVNVALLSFKLLKNLNRLKKSAQRIAEEEFRVLDTELNDPANIAAKNKPAAPFRLPKRSITKYGNS